MPIAKQPNKWNTAVTCGLPMPRMIPEPAACRPSNSWNAPAIGTHATNGRPLLNCDTMLHA
jgi:hypothetical protein